MADPDLLIVGASVRSAAWCAVRAGLTVAALDRYNDLDLCVVADPVFRWDDSDEQVERVVGELGVPWVYVGPLENRPDLIDRCAARAPLRGNAGDVLRAVRDPLKLAAVLREWAGSDANADGNFRVLDVRPAADPPPFAPPIWQHDPRLFRREDETGPWLVKPLASCGGYGIDVWDEWAAEYHPTVQQPHYFQRIRSSGKPVYPGSFSADAGPHGVRWLGACRTGNAQVFGLAEPSFRNEFFRGPGFTTAWPAPLMGHLADRFGLRGPFGLDVVAYSGGPGRWAAVELNPRVGASMDLFPTAHGPFGTASAGPATHAAGATRCRRTVFADGDVRVGRLPVFGPADGGWVADVSPPGAVVRDRHPICTVYADDDPTGEPGRRGLAEAEAKVRAVLSPV